MGTSAEAAIVDYHLFCAKQGQKLLFSVFVCSKPTVVGRFYSICRKQIQVAVFRLQNSGNIQ
jgi:hypothetical protein